MTATPLVIPITIGPKLKSGTVIVSGFVPAGTLIPDNFRIPYRDFSKKTGYQRSPQQQRINELANDLRLNRVDLPTAVLLNVRDRSSRNVIKEGPSGPILDFGLSDRKALPEFYVVDGQHRILALKKLIEDATESEESDKWRSFTLPFVCMLGADEAEEMNQFYIVNSKAKAVRTDLAYTLLKERADQDPAVYNALVEQSKEWMVDGQAIAERLAEVSPIWKQRLRHAGMDRGDTTVTNASFVTSLRPLLKDSPFFKRTNPDQRLKIIEAYWHGIRANLREAFDEPANFSIQKGIGVTVLHELLPDVLEIIRTQGQSVLDPSSYEKVIAPVLLDLQGDSSDGSTVQGLDFWRAASGAAGTFSSSAGKRVLLAKMRSLLPQIAAE